MLLPHKFIIPEPDEAVNLYLEPKSLTWVSEGTGDEHGLSHPPRYVVLGGTAST